MYVHNVCAMPQDKFIKTLFGYVKVSHSRQIVKDIINEVVSGALSQCEPTIFVPEGVFLLYLLQKVGML